MTKRQMKSKLTQMRKLVASTHWIKGSYMRWVNPEDPRHRSTVPPEHGGHPDCSKQCWCLVGLINTIAGAPRLELMGDALINSRRPISFDHIGYRQDAKQLGVAIWGSIKTLHPRSRATVIENWNDNQRRTREEVLAVLDHAIASL